MKSMFSRLNSLKWHDGDLLGVLQQYTGKKRDPGRVSLTILLPQPEGRMTKFIITFSGVSRFTQCIDSVELADNAGAGNIMAQYSSQPS